MRTHISTIAQRLLLTTYLLTGIGIAVKLAALVHELAHIIPLKAAGYDVTLVYEPTGPPGDLHWAFGKAFVYPVTDRAPTSVMFLTDTAPFLAFTPVAALTYQSWPALSTSPLLAGATTGALFMLLPSGQDIKNLLDVLNAAVHGIPVVPIHVTAADYPDEYWTTTL